MMKTTGKKGGVNPVDFGNLPEYYFLYGSGAGPGSEVSPVERLLSEFEAHEGAEEIILKQYREFAAKTPSPLIKTLLQLIISDEEKHRAITHSMLSTLKGDLNWTKPEDAIHGLYEIGAARQKLLAITDAFIQLEKEGLKESKDLLDESRGYHQGVFALLLRCMMKDSEKHIEIFKFLKDVLKRAR